MAVLQATTITGGLTMHGMAAGFMKINAEGAVVMDTNTYLSSGSFLPLSGGTVSGDLRIDSGTHSLITLGNPIGSSYGGFIQTSDGKRRVFIGANLYDNPSTSWTVPSAGLGSAGISLVADTGGWGTSIDFIISNTGGYNSIAYLNSAGMTVNGSITSDGNIYISNNGGRLYFDRLSGDTVGAIGFHSNDVFYVAGHPSYGPNAGNNVKVYGFGADLSFGSSNAGDVITINNSGTINANYTIIATGGSGTTPTLVLNRNIATPSNYYNGLQFEVRATSGTAGIGLHRNGYSHVGIYHDSSNELKFNMNSGTVILPAGAGTLWGSGNLTNLNQLSNGPGYITSSALSNYIYTNSGSFTTAGTGWYRVATTGSDGRGTYFVEVYTTGGNHNPSYLKIIAHGDWGNDKLVSVETDGGFPASAVRITRGASNTFLEVNFTTQILGAGLRVNRTGFDSAIQIYTGALPAGGDTVWDSVSVYSKGYHTPGAVFAKTRMLVGGTDDNSGKADLSVDTGGTATIALAGQYFRVGDSDVNWDLAIRRNGNVETYGQALNLNTQAGNYAVNIRPNNTVVAQYYQDYTYFPGLDFSISRVNSAHASNYFRGSSSHLVIGTGGTLYLNYGNTSGTTYIDGTTYINSAVALHANNYNSYSPTLTGGGASGTWSINITGSAGSASSASSVPWTGVSSGTRTNYDLGFAPSDGSSSYAGFYFSTPGSGGSGNAGYFLVRGGADNGVYTQNGITLVADAGWLTLAQRTLSDKGVRIMTGSTSTTRLQIDSSGNIDVGLGAGAVTLYHGGASRFWTGSDGTRTQGWSYFQNTGQGLHWPGNQWHLMPASASDFRIHSGSNTDSALRFETNGTTRGYFYTNSSNEIGILNNSRNWAFRTTSSNNAFIHGQTLTINADNAAWSSIYMNDGDQGMREIHCNSNRIGFLNQSGNWGAWNDDNGNWGMSLNAYMAGNRFDIQGAEGQISFKDGDNVWAGYVGFTGNLGYLSFPGRNVKINSGYNGTITLETGVSGYNTGVVSIPYGRLTVDNSYIYAGTYVEAGSDMRAPIYYDSQNTSFYGDFAGTSILNKLRLGNGAEVIDLLGMGASYYYGLGITSAYTTLYSHHQGNGVQLGYYNGSSFTPRLQVSNGGDITLTSGTSGTTGKLIFKTSDNADLNKYIMQDGYWTVIGTHSNEGLRVRDSAGNILINIAGSTNGYPSKVGIGNTTPAYKLHVSGDIYADGGWVRVSGSSGLYFESYGGGWHMQDSSYMRAYNGKSVHMNGGSVDYVGSLYLQNGPGVHLQGNTDGSYGSLQITQTKNSWAGIYFTATGNTLMMNSNESGFYRQGYGWQWRWENGTAYVNKNGQGGGTSATVLDTSNFTTWAQPKVYQGQSDGNWQNFTNDVGEFRVDEVLNINAGGHSNQPPNVYTYGGVLSWRTNNHSFQLYASHTGDITFKTQWGNDNYSGWRRILHESNYNSWAPSLTGGGASGTWGISITGKSETVTINYNNDSNSTYQLLWGSGNSVYGTSDVWVNPNSDVINARGGFISNGNPWGTSNSAFFPNGITTAGGTNWIYGFTYIGNAPGNGAGHEFYTSGSSYSTGDVEAAGSMRAPIFYDRNDTTYYLDPNSSSRLRYLYVGDGGSNWSNPGGWDTTLYISGVNHSIIRVENRQNNYHSALHSHTGQLPGVGSPGDYDFRITRNWSNRMVFYTGYTYAEGYLQAADSLRAPIFYDSNDTGYYLDPNDTSNLSRLIVNNAVSGAALLIGSTNTSRIINDNARKALVINADYYPGLHLNAYGGNNSTHGAYVVMTGNLSSGGYRMWTMGIANLNPGIFSIGYSDQQDGNGHYGVGDNWSGSDVHHGRLIIDTSGNTKIRGMLYVNGTSGGISTGSAVIHAGNIGSQSVNYASSSGTASNANALGGLGSGAYLKDDGWNNYPGQDANTQGTMYSDFTYSNNAPWTGELIRFGASGYSLQLNSQYQGSGLSFRSRNGDNGTWNSWSTVIHSNNIGSQKVDGAFKLWATSHPNDYYIVNNWTGSYWQLTSNHGSGVQVAYANDSGYASSAGNSSTVGGVAIGNIVRKDVTGQYLRAYYEYGSYLTTESPIDLVNQGLSGGGLRVDFMNNGGGSNWNHVITWSGYNGYNMYQLGGYYDGGTGTNLWVRSEANHGRTSWTAWRRLLNTSSDPYAANMNQYVRTSDNPTFNILTLTSYLTVGSGLNSSDIYMSDGDEGTRRIHCNSNRIGFLTQSASWGAYCDDTGNWTTDFNSYTGGTIFCGINANSKDGGVGLILNDGALLMRATGDNYHKIWYYDGIAFGTNNAHGHFRFYGETNTQRNASTPGANLRFDIDSTNGNTICYGELRATGDIVAYYSDKRLKKDVVKIDNALQKVQSITGVTYTWNEEKVNVDNRKAGTRDIGLIAQEVEAIEPLLTSEWATEGNETYKTIRYDRIVALLVEGMKEQQQQIEELKSKLDGLTK